MNENIERYKLLEREDKYKMFVKNKSHENDVLAQIEYNMKNKEKVNFSIDEFCTIKQEVYLV